MSTLLRDVRYALFALRRSPWFAVAALATLALGIGATTVIFSVVYGLLVRPLPFPEADRLVRLWEEHPGGTAIAGQRWLSNRTYEAWTAAPRTIEGIGAYSAQEYSVRLGDDPERMIGAEVSDAIFGLLLAIPASGRLFTADDFATSAKVLVISDRLWRERFAASADAIGRSVWLGEDPYTIIGVAGPEMRFPDRRVQFWWPSSVPTVASQAQRTVIFTAIGRLTTGATLRQAEAEGTAAARSMPRPMSADLNFGKGGPVVVHARALAEDLAAPVRPAAVVMAAAVACLLLIACANVANLLLSRGVARGRELAVRFAVGGSTSRIVRQLLTESLVLSIIGGALGVLLAWWLLEMLPAVAPARLPRVDDMRLDWRVLAFATAATVACAIAAGVMPALRGARTDIAQAFRGEALPDLGLRGRRLRDVLLVAESAIAVMLLVGAGLLAHSFVRLTMVDAGYSAQRVIAAQVQLPRGSTPDRTAAMLDRLLPRLRSTPGVVAAGAGSMMPMVPMTAVTTFPLNGKVGAPDARMARARTYIVTAGYAEALQLRLRAGRLFLDDDARRSTRPMLVNEAFARQYLSDGPVVGRLLANVLSRDTITEIVGVVGNVLKDGNNASPEPEVYMPSGWPPRAPVQHLGASPKLVVRTAADPAALIPVVRGLVQEADAGAAIDRIEPLSTMVDNSSAMAQPRFAARAITVFALVALLLAAVGLFGVLSYTVAQRQRELGIRAALGAHRSSLIGLVLREGLGVTLVGIGIGLAGAAALTRFMQGVLFGVTPLDPLSFAAAPLLLVPVAVLACLGPALRAATADPAVTLRQ